MMNTIFKLIAVAIIALLPIGVNAADSQKEPKKMEWPFAGITGHFDKPSIQRGFQVYKEVCASCHSLNLLSYRNLEEIGFSKEEVKAIASGYNVMDGSDGSGDMFERPARPSDRFVSPYPNEKAARASNGGAYPVDLSLIVKARVGGANYIYSILTGYNIVPDDVQVGEGMNYNLYFPGRQIAMPAPLSEGLVEYMDGTESTVEQMSYDVTNFLQWAAEPEMEKRKRMGVKVLMFMVIFTGLFIIAKKRVWARLDKK